MDAFDAHNELTDRYLRGALNASELEAFVKDLEHNPELKKEILFKQQLVEAIQEHGAANLKHFIRSRTTRKKAFTIAIKTWYYAAAAVAIILVASVVLLLNKEGKAPDQVASETSTGTGYQKDLGENGTAPAKPAPLARNNNRGQSVTAGAGEEAGSLNEDQVLSSETQEPEGEVALPEVIVIASNIPVIPIRIESELQTMREAQTESVPAMRSVEIKKSRKADSNPTVAKKGAYTIDSAIAREKAETMNQDQFAKEASRFKLNFYSTQDGVPMVSTKPAADKTSTEVMVYNLPYENPLIFSYQNKYYLKAGNHYYEFQIQKTGDQKVTPVTDPNLLEALNK